MNAQKRSGRPAVGECIDVPGYGRCQVVGNDDHSLVTVRTASGAEVRIGEKALHLALLAADGDDVRPTQ